jgi:hypothetical protein
VRSAELVPRAELVRSPKCGVGAKSEVRERLLRKTVDRRRTTERANPAPGEAGAGQVKRSDPDDVTGLWTLGAVDDFELHVLSLFE